MGTWHGEDYQRRFDELAASGVHVHGEADLVSSYGPRNVLDAGCGTGRVAIELARRGVEVVGVDLDASMIDTARGRAPDIEWHQHDLATLDLRRWFDVVVMAGNVVLFTPEGTVGAVVARCATHVDAGGRLVAGFQLGRGVTLAQYDEHAAHAGLVLEDRWSTWDREPFDAERADYAVSVHRRPDGAADRPTTPGLA